MATRVVTVNDILDGHVGLDLECFDRIYLNGWVPNLQVSGQVVNFLTHHLGFPIPSPALLEKIGLRFRKDVGPRPLILDMLNPATAGEAR